MRNTGVKAFAVLAVLLMVVSPLTVAAGSIVGFSFDSDADDSETNLTYVSDGNTIDLSFGLLSNKGYKVAQGDIVKVDDKYNVTFELELIDGYAGTPLVTASNSGGSHTAGVVLDAITKKYTITFADLDAGQYRISVNNIGSTGLITYKATAGGKVYLNGEDSGRAAQTRTIHVSDSGVVGAIAVADPGYVFLYWADAAGNPLDTCYNNNPNGKNDWVLDNFAKRFTPSTSHSATYTAIFVNESDSDKITTYYMDNSQQTDSNGYYLINFPSNTGSANSAPVIGQTGVFYDSDGQMGDIVGYGYRTGATAKKSNIETKWTPTDRSHYDNGYLAKTFASGGGKAYFYENNLVFWLMELTGNKSDKNVSISFYALSDLQKAGIATANCSLQKRSVIFVNKTDTETMYVAEDLWDPNKLEYGSHDNEANHFSINFASYTSLPVLGTAVLLNYNSSVDRQYFKVSFSEESMAKLRESALVIVINENTKVTNIPLFISGEEGTYAITVRNKDGDEVVPYYDLSDSNGIFPTAYGDFFVRTANRLANEGGQTFDIVYLLIGGTDGYEVTITATSGNKLVAVDGVHSVTGYSGRTGSVNVTLGDTENSSETQWSFRVDSDGYDTVNNRYIPSHFYYVKVESGKSYSIGYLANIPETGEIIEATPEFHPEHSTVLVNGHPEVWREKVPVGYEFGGWYDSVTGKTYQPGDTFALVSNVLLSAVYYPVELELDFVKQDPNNDLSGTWGSGITEVDGKVRIPQTYATAVDLPKITAPQNYYFAGWYCTDGSDNEHLIYNGYRVDGLLLTVSQTEDKSIYPKFEQKPVITIVGDSSDVVYDGSPHTVNTYSVYVNGEKINGDNGTYSISLQNKMWRISGISHAVTGTDVDSYTGTLTVANITVNNAQASSDTYILNLEPGTLTIEKAQVSITTPSVSKEYDGNPVNISGNLIIAGLVNGHTVTNYVYENAGVTDVGNYSNMIRNLTIRDGNGNDVTNNYAVIVTPGLIEITKGSITVKMMDTTVTYDGSNQSVTMVISGNSFPTGTRINGISVTSGSYTYITSYRNAGSYQIICDLSDISADVLSKFNITTEAGTLVIEKRNIVIESGSRDGVITDGDTISNSTIIVKDNDVICSPVDGIYSFVGGAKIGVTSDNVVLTEPNKVVDNTFSYTFIEGSDDNYIVECKYGKLSSIEPKMNTLVVYIDPTNSLIYNGKSQSHTNGNIKSLNTFIDSEPNVFVSGSGPGYSWRSCYGDDPAFNTDFTLNISVKWSGKTVGQYTCSASNVTVSLGDKTKVTTTSGADPNTFIGKAGNDNWYTIEIHTGILTIKKAPLTIIADDKNISYGDGVPGYTYTVSGFVNGETYNKNVITGTPQFSSDYTVGSDVGTYPIYMDISGVSANNYSISAVNGTLTVNKATPTIVTHISDAIYGEALDPTSDVKIAGDLLTDGISHQYSSDGINWGSAPTNVGDYYVRCVVNGADNYNSAVGNPVGFSILRKEVTLALDNTSLEFNGSEQTVKASVTNSIGSDDVSPVCTGTTKAKDVGMYAATAVELTGADKDNYKLPDTNSLIWNITKKAVTVKADNLAKIYGSDDPTLTATVSGLIGDDTVSYNLSREIGEDAGTYAIEVSGATEQGNYSVSYANGTFTITPASGMILTIHDYAGIYDGKFHEGTVTPSVTDGTAILYSLDGGMTWSETVPTVKDVSDSKTVKVKASNKNYADTLEYDLKLTVIKRNVTITSASETRDYNGVALTNDVITVSGDGFITGEGATYDVTGTRMDAGSAPNTFTYVLTSVTKADNYNITKVEGTLTVTKIKLTKPTEDTTSFTYAEIEYEYKPVGFDSTTMNITGEKRTNTGDHTVTVIVGDKANYTWDDGTNNDLTFTFTINRASATIVWGSTTFTYNGSEQAPTATFADVTGAMRTLPVIGAQTNVGTYTASVDVSSLTNYTVTNTSTDFTIKKADLFMDPIESVIFSGSAQEPVVTVTGVNGVLDTTEYSVSYTDNIGVGTATVTITPVSANYNGATVTFYIMAASGLYITVQDYIGKYDGNAHAGTVRAYVGGDLADDATIEYSTDNGVTWSETEPAVKDVMDSKTVKVKATKYGFESTPEYELHLTVTKRNVTITSASETREYNGVALTNDSITVSGDGFVDGEGVTYDVTGTRMDAGSTPNTFTYVLTSVTKADNYNIIKVEGTLTVTKAVLTKPVADDTEFIFNSCEQTYMPDNFDDAKMNISGEKRTNAGEHTVVVNIRDKANYIWNDDTYDDLTFTFTINRAEATIVWGSTIFTYNGSEQVPTATFSGFKGTRAMSVIGAQTDAGTYTASVDVSSLMNYTVSNTSTEFTIEKADIAIGPIASVTYNGMGQQPAIMVNGVNGTLAVTDYTVTYSNNIDVGTATVTVMPVSINYNGSSTTFLITPAAGLSLTVKDYNGIYDGASHTGTVTPSIVTGTSILYSIDGEVWSTDVPTVKNVADSITLRVKATNSNYVDSHEYVINLTVTARNVVLTSATADKVFDGAALVDGTVTVMGDGFILGEGVTYNVTGTITDAGSVSNAFTYDLIAGTDADNYNISVNYGELRVNAASLIITVNGISDTVVYDGNEHILSDYTMAYNDPTGIFSDNDVSGAFSVSGINVGTYEADVALVNNNSNFNVTFVIGNGTVLNISPREITVTATDASKVYGGSDPYLGSVITGIVEGDHIVYSVIRMDGEDAGTYSIVASGGSQQGNYIVTYVPGTFTILRKDVTVEAMSSEKFFGDEDPVLSATVNGLVDDTVIKYVIVREAGEDAGKYAIHVSGEVQQGNYNVIFVDSVLDILGPNHVTIVVKMVDTSGEVIDVSAFNHKVGESVAIGLTAPEGYYLLQDTVSIDVTEAVVITVTCYTMEELIEILEGDADPDNSIIVDHANVRVDPKIHKFPWYIPLLVALMCIVLYWSIAYESEYAVTRKKF